MEDYMPKGPLSIILTSTSPGAVKAKEIAKVLTDATRAKHARVVISSDFSKAKKSLEDGLIALEAGAKKNQELAIAFEPIDSHELKIFWKKVFTGCTEMMGPCDLRFLYLNPDGSNVSMFNEPGSFLLACYISWIEAGLTWENAKKIEENLKREPVAHRGELLPSLTLALNKKLGIEPPP